MSIEGRKLGMKRYHYTECGLDNVIINGAAFIKDDNDDETISIPYINGLHRAIAQSIVTQKGSMTGKELRFLRTELGMTQAQMAELVHHKPLSINRWENGKVSIDGNAEVLIRRHAAETLGLDLKISTKELSGWCVASAKDMPITIDGSNPKNYHPMRAA